MAHKQSGPNPPVAAHWESPSHRSLLVTASSKQRCDPWCRKNVFPKALLAAKHILILSLRDGRAPVPAKFRAPAAEPHHELVLPIPNSPLPTTSSLRLSVTLDSPGSTANEETVPLREVLCLLLSVERVPAHYMYSALPGNSNASWMGPKFSLYA